MFLDSTPRLIDIIHLNYSCNNKQRSVLIQFHDVSVIKDTRFNNTNSNRDDADIFRAYPNIKLTNKLLPILEAIYNNDLLCWVTYKQSKSYSQFCVTNLKLVDTTSKNFAEYSELNPEELV